MSFIPISSSIDIESFKSSTLLVPTVSIGNVPQLTTDLMVHTFQFEKVGYLDDDNVMPISGVREDSKQPGVTVAIEVFQTKDKRWTCIQQRSPTVLGKREGYLNNIKDFAASFNNVIIYTSMDASRRLDVQIRGEPFRVLGSTFEGVKTLEGQDEKLNIPGSGLAKHLYQTLISNQIQTALFVMFVLEGDNVQDGVEYARFLNQVLNIYPEEIKSWSTPESWKYLFGTPYNADLYQ